MLKARYQLTGLIAAVSVFLVGLALLPSTTSAAGPAPTPVTLVNISTPFNFAVGIDTHEPTNKVVMSVNYPSGLPYNLELVAADGSRAQFGATSGLTDELKIATVRSSACQGGFLPGELFVGTGLSGQLDRLSPTGTVVSTLDLDGAVNNAGLFRGSMFQDRFCVAGGDLIAATTNGFVYRVTSGGTHTLLAQVATHLEGVSTVPNDPRYGPFAGKIIAGAENQSRIYIIDPATGVTTFTQIAKASGGFINVDDIDIVPANENFFGVNYAAGRLVGAPAA